MLKKLTGLFLGLTAAFDLAAVPACPYPVLYTDPDGNQTTVTIQGDEYFQTYTTSDGRIMIADEDNRLQQITPDEAVARRKAAPRRAAGLHSSYVGHSGSPRVCVILVQFSDVQFSMSDPRTYFSNQLNQSGFMQDGAIGSVRDYYSRQSKGAFTPQFDVYGPATLSSRSTYTDTSNGYKMVWEGAGALDSQIDFGNYDTNNDGNVDNVCIIFAGGGRNGGVAGAPWPHASDCPTSVFNRKRCDNKTLAHYLCTSELQAYINKPALGTFIHEFSHILGLPDHYNTSTQNEYTPNYWDVMDLGCYNNGGVTPCNYSAHERYAMGWMNPQELNSAAAVTLRSFESYNHAYIIQTGRSGDYYLLENRTKTGFDAYLPAAGMLIWHIDASDTSKFGTGSNAPNNDSSHLRVDVVEADGTTGSSSYGGDVWPGTSKKTSFTSTSSPAMVRWNGSTGSGTTAVNKPITNITMNSSGVIRFDFMGGSSTNLVDPAETLEFKVEASPAVGGTVVIANNEGTVFKVAVDEPTTVRMIATPKANYEFVNWTFNGAVFSIQSDIRVASDATRAGTYVANFRYVDPTLQPTGAPQGSVLDTYFLKSITCSGDGVTQTPYTASSHPGKFYNELPMTNAVSVEAGQTIHLNAVANDTGSGTQNIEYSVAYVWRETANDQWSLVGLYGRKSMSNALFVKNLNTTVTFPEADGGTTRRIRILYAYSYLSGCDELTPTSTGINHGICYDIPVQVAKKAVQVDPTRPFGTTKSTFYLKSISLTGDNVKFPAYTASAHPGSFNNTLPGQATCTAGTTVRLSTRAADFTGSESISSAKVFVWLENEEKESWTAVGQYGSAWSDNSAVVRELDIDIPLPECDHAVTRRIRMIFAYSYMQGINAVCPTSTGIEFGICYDIVLNVAKSANANDEDVTVTILPCTNGSLEVSSCEAPMGALTRLKSGDKVKKNWYINIVPVPAAGYELDQVMVNNIAVNATCFQLLGPITVSATFKEAPKDNRAAVTILQPQHGFIEITSGDSEDTATAPVNSGDRLETGTWLKVNTVPENGYILEKLMVNGMAVSASAFQLLGPITVTATFVEGEGNGIELLALGDDADIRVFNLQGIEVKPGALTPGVYILYRNGEASKVYIR